MSCTNLALYYSMFCIALQSYLRDGEEPAEFKGFTVELADTYRRRAAQCLLNADIATANHNSVEAHVLYTLAEYGRTNSGDIGLWMHSALVVRKAMQMGYHRDPSTFSSISPFEGEMRRRVWYNLTQTDFLLSFQLGLPAAVRCEDGDVAPPRYLYEEELFEAMTELPPSRQPSEPTPISYTITKINIVGAFAKVVSHVNRVEAPSYAKVVSLIQDLTTARDSIPAHLKFDSMDTSPVTDKVDFMKRLHLQLFYDKAICVLNRKWMAVPGSGAQYLQSRYLCGESSLSLLRIQRRMHLAGIKWWTFSLSNYDFLLAAVVLCLLLHTAKDFNVASRCASFTMMNINYDETELIAVLENSKIVWADVVTTSSEARKGFKLMNLMLERLKTSARSMSPDDPSERAEIPKVPAASKQGLSSFAPIDFPFNFNMGVPPTNFADLEPVDPSAMDWASWDDLIQGADLGNLDQLWGIPNSAHVVPS